MIHPGRGYLTYNGRRIGSTTIQDFEFMPDPDSGTVHMIRDQPWECDVGITMAFNFEPAADVDVLLESVFPELAWAAFGRDLARRLKWLI